MKIFKNFGIAFLYIIGLLFVLTFLITLLNYFNLIGSKTIAILEILIFVIAVFIGGIVIGKRSSKKGWLEGLKLSGIFLIILLIFNYLGLDHSFEIKDLIFYLILIGTSTFGGMVGISKNNWYKKLNWF